MKDVCLSAVQSLHLQTDEVSILPAVEGQRNPWVFIHIINTYLNKGIFDPIYVYDIY